MFNCSPSTCGLHGLLAVLLLFSYPCSWGTRLKLIKMYHLGSLPLLCFYPIVTFTNGLHSFKWIFRRMVDFPRCTTVVLLLNAVIAATPSHPHYMLFIIKEHLPPMFNATPLPPLSYYSIGIMQGLMKVTHVFSYCGSGPVPYIRSTGSFTCRPNIRKNGVNPLAKCTLELHV